MKRAGLDTVDATVAVTGMNATDNPAPGVPVARALRHEPAFRGRIVGLGYDALDPGFYTQGLVSGGAILPYPSAGREALRERLRWVRDELGMDVLIANLDSELRTIIALAPELEREGTRTFLPSLEALERTAKVHLPRLAADADVDIPPSQAVLAATDVAAAARSLGLPVVVKGVYYGAVVATNEADAVAAFHRFAAEWGLPVIVQQFVPGEEYNVAALGDGRGNLVGAVAMRKMMLTDKGKGWCGVAIDNPELVRICEAVVGSLRWRGPLEVEILKSAKTGETFIIEINPRFPAWIHLSAGAGLNLPYFAVRLALGLPLPSPMPRYRVGTLFVRIAVDQICDLSTFEQLAATGVLRPEHGAAVRVTRGMTARYERPLIVRHSLAGVNKFGAVPAVRPMTAIDGVRVDELVAAYGSPLFVFSEAAMRERVRELRAELGRRLAHFDVAWSYKTNYLGAVCRIFHQEGSFAEVVSGMELRKALAAGVTGPQIIFNGPAKTAADLTLAFGKRVQVNLDHLDELTLAESVADELGVSPEVGLRISQSELPVPTWDRFGFHLESGRALEAARRLVRGGRLSLTTLHSHIGTFIADPEAYRLSARALARFACTLGSELGLRITTLDLGGGFASHNTLHAQYLPGEEATPSLAEYVEAIAAGLAEGMDGAEPPHLVLETGRALVDDAGVLVATVVGNKRLTDRRRAVILDAGVNLLPTAWWYRHDIRPAQEIFGTAEPTVFFGPLCMAIDVVRDRIMFPALRVGERVVIQHVGAYNVTQWMQFITLRPQVVLVSPKGQHACIRQAETLETLLALEQMPAWL